jgi:hypothetical protein
MRVRAVAIVGLGAVALLSCSKLATIKIHSESTTTVDRGTLVESFVGDMGFGDLLNMNVVDAEELRNQGITKGDIQDVRLDSVELEVSAPAGGDLSWVDTLEFYVEAPGLPRTRIAHQEDFPAGQSIVDLVVDDVDLTDYAISESMDITTDAAGHRPDQDTDVIGRVVLKVGVTAQGACNATKGSN